MYTMHHMTSDPTFRLLRLGFNEVGKVQELEAGIMRWIGPFIFVFLILLDLVRNWPPRTFSAGWLVHGKVTFTLHSVLDHFPAPRAHVDSRYFMMSKSHAWNQMQREATPGANDQLQKLADCNLPAAAGQRGQLDRCCFRNPLLASPWDQN